MVLGVFIPFIMAYDKREGFSVPVFMSGVSVIIALLVYMAVIPYYGIAVSVGLIVVQLVGVRR